MSAPRKPAIELLAAVRDALAAVSLPLPLDDAAEQRDAAAAAVRQIDDYIRPRLTDLDAPLLAVVGGSTGAGKSTLVNALVGSPVTRAGVIRPTTRQPILLHAPEDAGWFASDRILPGLARVRGRIAGKHDTASNAGDAPDSSRIGELVLLADERVPVGIAMIDAPDIDSVADENRALAGQLLAAADLWLFVTTANRYADAVPWKLLDDAASRNITVGVVLNRVPAQAAAEVRLDLERMLTARGLDGARIFTITEQPLDRFGMLPKSAVKEVREWLTAIAGDRVERARIAAATLGGAIADLVTRVERVAAARQAQLDWAAEAESAVEHEYAEAATAVDAATQDGALLRGEVLARWQDFVGTSDVFRTVESWFSRARDAVGAWLQGVPQPVRDVETTIEHGLHAVIVDQAGAAAAATWRELQRTGPGRAITDGHAGLARESAGFPATASMMIRDWQGSLMQLINDNVGSKRTRARILSLGLNAVTVALIVVVFASTGGLTGGEIVIAGGSAVVGQKLLETVFGEDAVRRLAKAARVELTERVQVLFDSEAARYTALLETAGPSPEELRTDAAALAAEVASAAEGMSRPTLDERLAALAQVRDLGAGRIPEVQGAEIDGLLGRSAGRRALSGEHTVVGLFGATGSGKSSLLNALVGEQVATSHVRRPTTSEPLAVTWDAAGAVPLLDWLGVRSRHSGSTPLDARASQLILLDLPDFDSVESLHRDTAERLASQVDALVWVVDPQKYADAVLHADFIATHSRHGAVTIVVLNQVDLLQPAEVPRVIESLRGLLAADGLPGVRVLATSATTGEGIGALKSAIGDLAAARVAQAARLAADVSSVSAGIQEPGTTGRVGKSDLKKRAADLAEQLAIAGGVDIVANAVGGSYRKRSGQATGWPLVSWILRFRADPLARLGLNVRRGKSRDPELHRSSMPTLNAAGTARVSLAVRGFADTASEGLTEPWRAGARESGQKALDTLPAALDLAIARTALPTRGSWWWVPFGILQWVSIAAALAGVLWLLLIALLPGVALLLPPVPKVEGWPATTLLVAGGVLLGILLGLAGAALGAVAGAQRRRAARKALLAQVALVAQNVVVEPVAAELGRAAAFASALASARG